MSIEENGYERPQPEELVGDAALLAKWKKIADPYEALKEIVAHSEFLGSDPYYRDLNDGLLEMAERVAKVRFPLWREKR